MRTDRRVVVVVPSRGRPAAAGATLDAIAETAVRISTETVLAVDRDDPELEAYREVIRRQRVDFRRAAFLAILDQDETGDLVRATNTVSLRIAREDPECIIGNLGDDHRTRTPGWDRLIAEALETPGIAYGDDLLQRDRLPTAPFLSASIVLALGWYALPVCRHMFIDDAWRALGDAAGCLRYLPDVVIEHLHPGAGKAELDDGYVRADASTERDRAAFWDWRSGRLFAADVANVRRAVGG